jgi:uncharacterized protein (DUF305 family)
MIACRTLMLAALLASGCSAAAKEAERPPSASPSPSIMVAVSTDAAWTQLVMALDERILTVLDLAPTRSRDAGVIALSTDIAAQHRSEISQLRENLHTLGMPDDNPHATHEMPGMVTAAAFEELKLANGTSFDRLLAVTLHAHLSQCVWLARSELKAGTHEATRALATSVQSSRERDLSRLQSLLPQATGT